MPSPEEAALGTPPPLAIAKEEPLPATGIDSPAQAKTLPTRPLIDTAGVRGASFCLAVVLLSTQGGRNYTFFFGFVVSHLCVCVFSVAGGGHLGAVHGSSSRETAADPHGSSPRGVLLVGFQI